MGTDTSRDTAGHMSEASPVDEESSGGWSDDDSATIKSEFTEATHGTLGSAIVVDATHMTSTEEASKKLRRMVAIKAAQSKEDIVFGPPPSANASQSKDVIIPGFQPSAKASLGEEIIFTPPAEESNESESNNDGTDKKANKASKKKKKKKSKKNKAASSEDHDIDVSDMFDESV